MPSGVVGGKSVDVGNTQQPQGSEKTINVGIFFDGTGNNKFQVMLGKLFRNTEAINKNVKDAKGRKFSIGEIRAKGRGYWESQHNFTKSELDEIFFGYDGSSSQYFIENSIHHVDLVGQQQPYQDMAAISAQVNLSYYYDMAQREFERDQGRAPLSKDEWNILRASKKIIGIDSYQDSTYTNVAILEALYNDATDYYPIYVEGAGTNMDMSELGGSLDLVGAGTGKGVTGVWAKVKKAALAVQRISDKYLYVNQVSKLTIKMSVYGFSRGATEARMFSYLFNPTNKEDIQSVLKKLILSKDFLKHPKLEKKLNFVGLFDTVATVGVGGHEKDVEELYLYGIDKAERVLHLCAMDEFRSNFALTDISSAYSKGCELFIPGCHADVGGGITLGVDDWKQIDTKDCCISKWGRYNSSKPLFSGKTYYQSEYASVDQFSLKQMGWLTDWAVEVNYVGKYFSDTETENVGALYHVTMGNNIQIKRYVKPGYSNIPLALMHKNVSDRIAGLFKSIPISYSVRGTLLQNLYKKWVSLINGNGQCFIGIKNADYKSLRSTYLHYSGNDTTVNGVVNSVSHGPFEGGKRLITRKIYKGQKNQETSLYYLSSKQGNTAPHEQEQYNMRPAN